MTQRSFCSILATALPILAMSFLGCGGSGSSETPPPVEGVKPAPDAPFGGLGNPYNEPEKTPKKKG